MEVQSHSSDHLPEVVPSGALVTSYHPYEDFEYYERQPLAQTPENRQDTASPPLLTQYSPRLTSERATSPSAGVLLEHASHREHTTSPSINTRFSEYSLPGLQTVYGKGSEKEVSHGGRPLGVEGSRQSIPSTARQQGNNFYGLSQRWFLVVAALIVCAILAIAIALGVVFGAKHRHSRASARIVPGNPDYAIGGGLDPQYFSTTGAFNGSGIAIASANFGLDGSIYLYFQHYTGEILSSILEADGNWQDGNVVATKARNGTPLSAVAYVVDEVASWHVFYIDEESYVRQRTSSNASAYQTNIWEDGPLNGLNLKANDADMIGLQACYWGNYYGDSDFTFSDGFNTTNETTVTPTGMHLWYADTNTSFQQYSWYNGHGQWENDHHRWNNMNGRAGVGCQTWETDTVSYVFMVDLENTVEIWWKDSNSSNETPTHPINKWSNTSIAIPNIHPSSSLGYTSYLVCQHADETIRGYNIEWAAENTTLAPASDGGKGLDEWTIAETFGVQDTFGIPGTHLSVTSLPDESGGAHLAIFFQVQGNDFTMYSRDIAGGVWTSSPVPVD